MRLPTARKRLVGHCWGPDSHEVLDTTLRADLILRDLFAFLDARVGKGRYVVALSADHGIGPLPEVSLRRTQDAGRLSARRLAQIADEFLQETFGEAVEPKGKDGKRPGAVESVAGGTLYLNRRWLKTLRVAPAEVDAPQARTRPRLHERADLHAALIRHDREVRHVGGQPRQVRARGDHPGAHEDRDVGVAGVDRLGVDGAVTHPGDGANERGDRLAVAADRDHGLSVGHEVGRGVGPRVGHERRSKPFEQRVDLGLGRTEP